MRVITIISLGASAVLGLGALFIAKTVMPNAATAENGSRAVANQVAVVVSTRDVTYGTKLDAGMLTVVQAPASLAPHGTLSNRRLRGMDDSAVVDAAIQIRGIGEWTAHMLLIFCLGRPDILPVGDYGVRKGAQILYELDELPKPKALAALTERWRPYRSIGSWYLWRVVDG